MESNTTITRADLLAISDAVAREKGIDREIVIEAMEQAIGKSARNRYGQEKDIRAHIDRRNGEISLKSYMEVVEEIEDYQIQMTLEQAQKKNKEIEIGGFITEDLPPYDFGRVAAQTAKQVIVQRVREAERDQQFNEYQDRVGEIIHGVVKRIEYGNITVDLGKAEGYLKRDEIIPHEHIKRGDRIRAYIYDVRREQRGPQIFLSRTHPYFMAVLFAQEVPEIYDGIIEVMGAARDPGSRAKIAVRSKESSVDPVGACVGMRGSRVQAVVNELQGEKIDIILWNDEPSIFIRAALAPAEITKVILDQGKQKIDVVVAEEMLSLAIGRRGQNVRLASILSGWDIDIMTEEVEAERRQSEIAGQLEIITKDLDVDDVIARLLIEEGYGSIETISGVDIEVLQQIQGFDPDLATEIQARAHACLNKKVQQIEDELTTRGVQQDLRDFAEFSPEMLLDLSAVDILSLEDFAGLAADEITSKDDGILRKYDIEELDAIVLVLQARLQIGWMTEEEYQEQINNLMPKDEVAEEAVSVETESR